MTASAQPAWTVIMPVKTLSTAKSRMDPDGGGAGGILALAFFRDTATAVLGCRLVGEVVVATADPVIARHAGELGCTVVDDSGHPGINAAASWAGSHRTGTGPVAVIVSDLPCLTAEALEAVLEAAAGLPASFLPDADGSGTTMWLATDGSAIAPRFGPGSAAAHAAAGARDLTAFVGDPDPVRPARRDVDTEADLLDARRIGVGPSTTTALDPARPSSPILVTALGRRDDGRLDLADEDGHRHAVDWETVTAAGFLDVRPGQRLVLDPGATPSVRLP